MINKFAFVTITILLLVSTASANPMIKRSDFKGQKTRVSCVEAGVKFTTGKTKPKVAALGYIDLKQKACCYEHSEPFDGLKSSATVTLWEAETWAVVARVEVPAGDKAILIDGFRYAAIKGGPITLSANTDYVLSSKSSSNQDKWLKETEVTLDTYYVGANPSSTWSLCWSGAGGGRPMNNLEEAWGAGKAYGLANMVPELPQDKKTTQKKDTSKVTAKK